MAEIEKAVMDLAAKAKDSKLTAEELPGAHSLSPTVVYLGH